MTPEQRVRMNTLVTEFAERKVRADELREIASKQPTVANIIAHETANTELIDAYAALRRLQGELAGPPDEPRLRSVKPHR